MGQKANLITLYSNKYFLNLSNFNNKFYTLGFNFLTFFKRLLLQKGALLMNECLNFSGNKLLLAGIIFFESTLLRVYKKKKKLLFSLKKNNNDILRLFNNLTSLFNITHIVQDFIVLNKFIDPDFSQKLYNLLKNFTGNLFTRRYSLFLDFIKLTSLFFFSKLPVNGFLFYISKIFKYLRKSSHSRFFSFIKQVFNFLIVESIAKKSVTFKKISGIKFVLKGRLRGKQMASNFSLSMGRISAQKLSNTLEFSKISTFTRHFGVFGFKIWISKL